MCIKGGVRTFQTGGPRQGVSNTDPENGDGSPEEWLSQNFSALSACRKLKILFKKTMENVWDRLRKNMKMMILYEEIFKSLFYWRKFEKLGVY